MATTKVTGVFRHYNGMVEFLVDEEAGVLVDQWKSHCQSGSPEFMEGYHESQRGPTKHRNPEVVRLGDLVAMTFWTWS